MSGRVVILGAGLAGLSASLHLPEDWEVEVLEREDEVGGLARSRRVEGFTFDYTGHLLHLRDDGMKELVHRLLPDTFVERARRAVIHSHGTEVEYPFQANLHGLPPEVVSECLVGFVEALRSGEKPEEAENFHEWARRCFGEGIARHFMWPYNEKLYCCDLREMTADWVSWSVPRPSLEQVVNGALGISVTGLGYNPTFLYPREGGIDALPKALAREARGVRLGAEVAAVDLERQRVRLADGEELAWDRLISTLPLPELIAITDPLPEDVEEDARRLRSVAVACFNLGIAREQVAACSWMYVPEPELPFYRVGFPATFCPAACPPGTSSAYVEVSVPSGSRVDLDSLQERVFEGLKRLDLIRGKDDIIVVDRFVIDPAYVVFDHHRSRVRGRLLDLLAEHGVQSIGRYGVWTYSSMEDALLAGRQAADVVAGRAEARGQRAGDR